MIEGARYWLSKSEPGSRCIVASMRKHDCEQFPGIVVKRESGSALLLGEVTHDWERQQFTEIDKPEFPAAKRKVRMAMAVMKRSIGDYYTPSFYYATRKEAETHANEMEFELIQWPLTINGVPQWVEIDIEEEVSE